jgi:putative endonuclease
MSGGAEARLLGKWGERLVAEELRRRGWSIAATNYRCRQGEIDIIAVNRCYIAFVEVKLRRSDSFAQAREYVDRRKQDRLRMTASLYLAEHPTRLQPRFDVIEIYAPQGMETLQPQIYHMEDAFQ